MKHVYLSWHEVEELVSDLIFKLDTPYDVILAITRGGIIPGGMIAEALKMKDVLTAAVLFPEDPSQRTKLSLAALPTVPVRLAARGPQDPRRRQPLVPGTHDHGRQGPHRNRRRLSSSRRAALETGQQLLPRRRTRLLLPS